MSAILCCVAVSKCGASSGRNTLAGCGSNVTTTGVPPASLGVPGRRGNDRLVAEMHAIEDADGQEERPGKLAQFRNRSKDLHRCSR